MSASDSPRSGSPLPGAAPPAPAALGLLAVLVVASVVAFRGLDRQEYASDEGMWIYVAQKTWPLFRTGAWGDPEWENMDATWGWVNPPVAKYILGAALEAQGESWEWRAGTRPPDPVLAAARAPSAVLGVLGCLGLAWIGTRTLGRGAGVLGGLLLAISPVWAEVSRRAMTDVYGAALGLLAVSAFVPALAELEGRRKARVILPWTALSGALAGMALGAKLNAASVPAFLGLLLIVLLARVLVSARADRARVTTTVVAAGVVFAAASGAAFVGLNPYLHEETWPRFQAMLAFWRNMCLERAARAAEGGFGSAFYPEEAGLRMLSGKFIVPLKAVGLPIVVAPLVAAGAVLVARGARARLVGWAVLVPATLAVAAGANQVIHPWLVWLGFLGAAVARVSGGRGREPGTGARGAAWLVPVWLAVAGYFVWRMTFLPQTRYYLPLLPVFCVVAGWGLARLREDVARAGRRWPRRLVDAGVVAGALSVLATFPDLDAAVAKRMLTDAPPAARLLHWVSVTALGAAIVGGMLPPLAPGPVTRSPDPSAT